MPQSIRVESVDDLPDLTVRKKGLPVPADIKNQEVREEPGYGEEFLQSYEKVTTPLWEGPSRGARAVTSLPDESSAIAKSFGLDKPYEAWRGAQETGLELAGDIASSQTAPLNLAMLIPDIASMGASRLGRQGLATGLRYAAKPAAGAVVGKGVYDVVDPESTMSERAVGTFNALLGAASIGRGKSGGTRELHAKNVTPEAPLRISDGPDSFRGGGGGEPIPTVPQKQLPLRQEPNLTKRPLVLNNDGTFTDKSTGEIIDRNGKVVGDEELDLRPVVEAPNVPILRAAMVEAADLQRANEDAFDKEHDPLYPGSDRNIPIQGAGEWTNHPTVDELVKGIDDRKKEFPSLEQKFTTADDIIEGQNAQAPVSVSPRFTETRPSRLGRTEPDPDEPTFQKTGAGKLIIGHDIKRSSGELTTGYSGPLPGIMAREAGQNAIDAMRKLGLGANLDINATDDFLEMNDNGRGMTRDEVFTVMSDLHSSGKATEAGVTGGKGVGKASYMLGGKSFELDTVAVDKDGRKYRTTVKLTPDEVVVNQADLLLNPNLGVDVTTLPVPDSTPTGTRIKTEFKDTQKKLSGGASARNMFRAIAQHSRGIQGNITTNFEKAYPLKWNDSTLDEVVSQDDPIKGGASTIDIIIPDGEPVKERDVIQFVYLNEGMFQFTKHINVPKTDGLPERVIINVKPKVEEGTDEYPFPLQRESIKEDQAKEILEIITNKLIKPKGANRKRDLMKLWADMTPLSAISGNREVVLYDPGARLTPSEVGVLQQSIPLLQLAEKFDDTINQILGYSGRPEWENRVVRVGITLDPNMHGVHIPNPGATRINGRLSESAILINPFIAFETKDPRTAAFDLMVTQLHETGHVGHEDVTITKFRDEDLNDPRVGPFLVSLVKEGEQHGGNSLTGHGHDWTNRLGDIYARYGTKRFLQAADEIESIIGWQGHPGRYSPEVQGLLSLYQSSRGRDATIEDILSGTGVRQENASGSKKVLPSNVEGSGNGTVKRTRSSSKLQPGEDLEYAKLRVPILLAKKRLNVAENKELGRLVAHYKKDLLSGGGGGVVPPTGGGGNVPPTGPIEPPKPKGKKEPEISVLRNVWNLSRGIMSTDLPFITSFALRQGKRHIGTGPWFKGWYDSVKAYGSEVAFKANDKVLRDTHKDIFRPTIEVRPDKVVNGRLIPGLKQSPIELAGVRLIDLDGPLTGRDEQIRSQWAERIPLLGRHIRASNRGYAAFGNALRVGAFENLYYSMAASGQTPNRNLPALKAMGDWVNNTTGSGKLATRIPFRKKEFSLERYAEPLAEILFSPRLIADNLQSFNPYNYFGMPKGMRLKYWETSARLAAAWMTFAVTAKLAGAEVILDPDNADFGKIKIGNLRLDPAGGLQQFLVLAHRMGSGEVVSSTTGRTRKMGAGGPYDPTLGGVIGDFVKNKIHPSAAFLAEFATATKRQPFGLGDNLLQSFTPMILQDLAELSAKDAYYKLLFAPLVSAGWGTQTYDRTSMKTGKFISPKNDLTYEGKGLMGGR